MEVSFQITEQDYFEYCYYTLWQAPWNKNKRIIHHTWTILLGLLVPVLFLVNKSETIEINLITVLLFWVIYFPLIIIISKGRFKGMARKIYHDPNNKGLFSKQNLSFNETGILGKNEYSDYQYKWHGLTRRHSTENLYILYTSDITGLVIPKRIFKTDTEIESFEKILAQYLPLQAELAKVE